MRDFIQYFDHHFFKMSNKLWSSRNKIIIRFVIDFLQKYVAMIISWMAPFRLAIFDIDQPKIYL